MSRMPGRARRPAPSRLKLALLTFALLVAGGGRSAHGQAAWEYTPYQVRVWLAFEPVPQLPPQLVPQIGEALAARAGAVFGAVWELQADTAPPALRDDLVHRLDALTVERVATAAKGSLNVDKLYLAALRVTPFGYELAVREIDGRTRQIGPVSRARVAAAEELTPALWDLIVSSFTPLAKIERVVDRDVVARLRAGGLVVDPSSRVLVEPGAALRPILRRNDRNGEPAKGGLVAVPWTLLRVEQRADSQVNCKLLSGFRNAIPTRGGSRTERLALVVRPRFETTRLLLRSRSDSAKALVGYDVYSRLTDDGDPQPIGATDAFGSLDIARSDGQIQTLYLRNGKQLLARLPIVPGQAEEMTVSISDDDSRLEAEGFVAALHSRALDLVAQREILAARFRARLKEGKIEDAQKLLDEFRKLEQRDSLSRALDQAQKSIAAGDRITQARIDKLFGEARKMLGVKSLSGELLDKLTKELTAAKGGGVAAAPAAGS